MCRGCTCGSFLSKLIIGISNAAILVAAIAILVAVVLKKGKSDYEYFWKLMSSCAAFSYVIALCVLIMVSSIFGFFLLCCNSKCWRVSYLIVIFILFAVEIGAVVFCYMYPDKVLKSIDDNWGKGNDTNQDAFYAFEHQFKCCTLNTSELNFSNYTRDHPTYHCGYNFTYIEGDNYTSCYSKVFKQLDDNMKTFRNGAIVLVVFEFLLLICAIYLACCWDPDRVKEDPITYVN